MDTILHKKPIIISVNTLNTLKDNFRQYTEPVKYSEDEKAQLEEAQTAIDLINGGIRQINRARQDLKSQISELKNEYNTVTTKEEKKALINMLEDIEKETNFNDVKGK